MKLSDLRTPVLLLDLEVLERNLVGMQDRANRLGVSLRPHVKTHKCAEIARKQVDLGASGLTVSTLREAELLAEAGFDDFTYAVPLAPVRAVQAWALAERVTLRVLVDGEEAIEAMVAAAPPGRRLHVWLKVDCGYHRVGVDPSSSRAQALARKLHELESFEFDGILTHAGHGYDARNRAQALEVSKTERDVMVGFAQRLRGLGIPVPGVSIGSTPTLTAAEDLSGVTEVRPGNYALYDAMQAAIGSCAIEDCAATVYASVISHQPGGRQFVIDAGALSLSQDRGAEHVEDAAGFGFVLSETEPGKIEDGLRLTSLSQEHGKVTANDLGSIEGRFRVGDRVRVLEQHSCLAVALFDEFFVVRGDQVVDRWPILRAR